MLIRAGKIYCENKIITDGILEIKDGKFYRIYEKEKDFHEKIEEAGKDKIIIPGFIDNHTHGGYGIDLTTASLEEIGKFAKEVAKEGTTSFLTTIGAKKEEIMTKFVENSAEYMELRNTEGAEVLGMHLEGPFLNPKHAGLQEVSSITVSSPVEQIENWYRIAGDKIKIMTVAPEIENMEDILNGLKKRNIVPSAGHSDATYNEMEKAKKLGVTRITHLFNGMRGIHHREPGIIGFAFEDKEVMAEMAGFDTYSILPEIWRMIYRLKGPEKMIITTDSGFLKGLPDGTYKNGERVIEIREGRIYTAYQGGNMHPGVPMKFIDCFKNVIKHTDAEIEDAVMMSCSNPAKEAGVFHRKGSISEGKDADFLILDENLDIISTYCRGKRG